MSVSVAWVLGLAVGFSAGWVSAFFIAWRADRQILRDYERLRQKNNPPAF